MQIVYFFGLLFVVATLGGGSIVQGVVNLFWLCVVGVVLFIIANIIYAASPEGKRAMRQNQNGHGTSPGASPEQRMRQMDNYMASRRGSTGNGFSSRQPGTYLVKCGDRYKIGTSSDLNSRIGTLKQQMQDKVTVVAKLPRKTPQEARALEKELHRQYAHKRVHGEWFTLDQSDVERIKRR